MSKLSVDDIQNHETPCGLGPKKSKSISELSKILKEKYKGNVPNNFKSLEKLPELDTKQQVL